MSKSLTLDEGNLMSFLDTLAPAPKPLPVSFDSVELRHMAMAEHDADCPTSWNLDRQCVCQPITYINGQPVYHTLPAPRPLTWEDDEDVLDHTERMERFLNG